MPIRRRVRDKQLNDTKFGNQFFARADEYLKQDPKLSLQKALKKSIYSHGAAKVANDSSTFKVIHNNFAKYRDAKKSSTSNSKPIHKRRV